MMSSLVLVLALLGGACGKAVQLPGDDAAAPGAYAGAGGTAGVASDFAAAPNAGGVPGGVGDGVAGEPAAAGGAGAAPDDQLAPLDIDDASIDDSAGQELIELTMSIGYARGAAVCTCLTGSPLSDSGLDGCARAESTLQGLFDPAFRGCVLEQSRAIPGFDERVRCRARSLRAEGRAYRQCPEGADGGAHNPSGIISPACEQNDAADRMLAGYTCSEAILCADGTLHQAGRCDQQLDCPDGSDERGCGDVSCGDQLIYKYQVCDPEACSFAFDPPLCADGDSSEILCGDGSKVSISVLCNDVKDCADGRDERYCY